MDEEGGCDPIRQDWKEKKRRLGPLMQKTICNFLHAHALRSGVVDILRLSAAAFLNLCLSGLSSLGACGR